MEDILLNLHFEDSLLEPLRPLTPENNSVDQLNELDSSLNQLATRENIEKFQNRFTDISKDFEELESFDWLADEKSVNLFVLENKRSVSMRSQDSANIESNNAFHVENFNFKPTCLSPVVNISGLEIFESQLTYASSFNEIIESMERDSLMSSVPDVDNELSTNLFQTNDLTPPKSPKEEDILSLLCQIKAESWDGVPLTTEDPIQSPKLYTDFLQPVSSPQHFTSFESAPHPSPAASVSNCSEGFLDSAVPSPSVRYENEFDDPDYLPYSKSSRNTRKKRSSSIRRAKRRGDPYETPCHEVRLVRKKEQNKNAASRYRMKKKIEMNCILNEEETLLKKNAELRLKLEDIGREIKCIKSLLREIYFKNKSRE